MGYASTFFGGDTLLAANKNLLPLFLAFGVTTIRDAGSDITSAIKEWRQQIKNGELIGPTIYTSGPKLDNFSSPGFIQVENQQDIEQALDSLESIGVDYVKYMTSTLQKNCIIKSSTKPNSGDSKKTGHIPLSVKIQQAVNYGLDGVEHFQYMLKPASTLADSLKRPGPGLRRFFPLVDSYDPDRADVAYRLLAEQDLYVTSTLLYLKSLAQIQESDHNVDTLLSYIGPRIQKSYQVSTRLTKSNGEQYAGKMSLMINRLKSMVEPVQKAGINVVAGTDSGPTSSYVYPGQSLHQELELLVEAGLSPAEALRSSIINGPKFFDQLDSYGSIEKGKTADLLLLRNNPLQNIKHTSSIQSVVARGHYYSNKELNQLLSSLKN